MKNERRKFLEMAGLIATATAGFGFTSRRLNVSAATTNSNSLDFKPVNVASNRVIRTVVGLRPYRPSGFVIKSERSNDKTIIHNYGHGGAGISLSWGTAKLAVDEALKADGTSYAVIGCGVIGLSTARLLQRRGLQVSIYAKDLPPNTTSNVAGALWGAGNFSVYNPSQVRGVFLDQLEIARRISYRMFQDLVGDKYGIGWIKNHRLGGAFDFDGGKAYYPGFKELVDSDVNFGYPKVIQYNTMLIEPSIYLNALLNDFYIAGGNLKVRQFNSSQEVISLQENVIINCTGIGSRELFNDKELTAIKGQMSILIPQPEIDYSYVAPFPDNLLYMFPRKDGIVLGGNAVMNDWSLEPNDRESKRIIGGHNKISKALGG